MLRTCQINHTSCCRRFLPSAGHLFPLALSSLQHSAAIWSRLRHTPGFTTWVSCPAPCTTLGCDIPVGGSKAISVTPRISFTTIFLGRDLPTEAASDTPAQKARLAIEAAAQGVLDARAQFQQGSEPASLADLYDPLSMPPQLLKAHNKLDATVDAAYALCGGKKTWKNDADRMAFLFERYQHLTGLLPALKPKSKPRKVPA
jgi:hypothetical protein